MANRTATLANMWLQPIGLWLANTAVWGWVGQPGVGPDVGHPTTGRDHWPTLRCEWGSPMLRFESRLVDVALAQGWPTAKSAATVANKQVA
eukprot:294183-Chlamydomonas_euryale.AAC.1